MSYASLIVRRYRLRLGLLVALLAAIAGGVLAARAQGQECRDVEQITICADTIVDLGAEVSFTGNIKLGPKGGRVLLAVRDMADEPPERYSGDPLLTRAYVEYTPGRPERLFVRGELRFIDDLTEEPLAGSLFYQREGQEYTQSGRFVLNAVDGELSIPEKGVDPQRPQGFEHVDGFDLAFIERANLWSLGAPVPPSMVVTVDFSKRLFRALVEVRLETLEDAEPISTEVTIDEGGVLNTTVNGFKAKIGGLTAQFLDVQLLDPFAEGQTSPQADGRLAELAASTGAAGLRIGKMEIRKADNPDLPSLDPRDLSLVFMVENVEYRDGRFSARAGTPIRDWALGNAFSLTGQRLTLGVDQRKGRYELTIDSTLTFGGANGAVSDTTRYPARLTIAAEEVDGTLKPLVRGTLGAAQPNLGLGPLRIRPQNVGLEFNPADNFYGLVAEQVALQWNAQAGGQSGPALRGFRLGVDRDRNLRFALGSGGELSLPEFRSSVLRGRLSGRIGAENNVLSGQFSGNLSLALPGNSGGSTAARLTLRAGQGVAASCAAGATGCLPRYAMDLSALELKLAGFTIAVDDPSGIEGGGIRAEKALLKAPGGLSFIGGTGVEVRDLAISGSGDISVAGGGIALPTIRAGGYEFTSAKGYFAKTAGGYEFRAGAAMPLPGISTTSGRKLDVDLAFRTRPDGSFLGTGVKIDFNGGSRGIPLGSTGMELTRVAGSFDTGSGSTKIAVTMRAVSSKQLRGIPIATVDGAAELQLRPFQLTANAKLALLVVEVARASVGIGAGQGFNGGDGFYAQLTVDVKVARGEVLVRMGKLTLSNGERRMSVALKATLDVSIPKHYFRKYIPPFSIDVAQVTVRGGDFQVKGQGEALGVIGSARCCWGALSANYFVDFRTGDVKSIEPDDYKLIGADTLRANAARGVPGYASERLTVAEVAAARGLTPAELLPRHNGGATLNAATITSERVPVTLSHAGTALFGISYPAGAPRITVQGPGGLVYHRGNITNGEGSPAVFVEEPGAGGGTDQAIVIRNAPAGAYTLIIDNAPPVYENVSYVLNAPPTLSAVAFSCSTYNASLTVATSCDGRQAGDGVRITFQAADADSPGANLYVGYAPVTESGAADLARLKIVSEKIALGAREASISTEGIPSGRYRILVGISDGANPPVEVISGTVVEVADFQAPEPARFASLEARGAPRAVLVRWRADDWPAPDVAGFEVAVGPQGSDREEAFSYIRDTGNLGLDDLDGDGMYSATIWGLPDQATLTVAVRAYDQDGNRGPWVSATAETWILAPNGQAPLPGGAALPTSSAQLLFDTPMVRATLNQHLALRDAAGKKVAGTPEFIVEPGSGLVYGMRFVPAAPLMVGATYEVVLEGGVEGVRAVDGRSMPGSYRWTFAVVDPTSAEAALIAPEPVEAEAPPAEGGLPGSLPGWGGEESGARLFLPLLRR